MSEPLVEQVLETVDIHGSCSSIRLRWGACRQRRRGAVYLLEFESFPTSKMLVDLLSVSEN